MSRYILWVSNSIAGTQLGGRPEAVPKQVPTSHPRETSRAYARPPFQAVAAPTLGPSVRRYRGARAHLTLTVGALSRVAAFDLSVGCPTPPALGRRRSAPLEGIPSSGPGGVSQDERCGTRTGSLGGGGSQGVRIGSSSDAPWPHECGGRARIAGATSRRTSPLIPST